MVQVTVAIFLFFDEIIKIKEVELKNMYFFYIIWKNCQNPGFWVITASIFRFHQLKKILEK